MLHSGQLKSTIRVLRHERGGTDDRTGSQMTGDIDRVPDRGDVAVWREHFMRIRILIVVLAAIVAMPAVAVAAPKSSANCENVATSQAGVPSELIIENGELVGNNIEFPLFGGTVFVTNTVNKTTPGGTLHFTGVLDFVETEYGTFGATSKGVVAPNGKLNITVTIEDGDATGFFTTHGVFYPDGSFDADWKGRICKA
jgi:hypothetical protein